MGPKENRMSAWENLIKKIKNMTHNYDAIFPRTDVIYVAEQKKQGLVLALPLTS